MSGVYADVSMYKDWIDKIMTSKKLPDYEHSPFPKPPQPPNALKPSKHNVIGKENEDDEQIDEDVDNDDDQHGSADRPKLINTIAISFAVIISMISNLV